MVDVNLAILLIPLSVNELNNAVKRQRLSDLIKKTQQAPTLCWL